MRKDSVDNGTKHFLLSLFQPYNLRDYLILKNSVCNKGKVSLSYEETRYGQNGNTAVSKFSYIKKTKLED